MNGLFKKDFLIIFIIFLAGLYLRVFNLIQFPVGLHIDEAQIGYNSYSLLKTGHDETGKFLPTHLTLWKVDRPLLISYLTIPSIYLLGLNEFSTRLPTAIIGALSIILVFLLTLRLFKNKYIAYCSSILFALSPWHIELSRATSEAVICLAFYLLGTIFIFDSVRKNSIKSVLFGYISFVISFFSYHSTRITIPIILLFFSLLAISEKRKTGYLLIGVLILYLIFPLAIYSKTSIDRFKLISVFSAGETKLVLDEQLREDGNKTNTILSRIFHNKAVNYSLAVADNFSSYFSYSFLFSKGGLPIRYNIPNMGLSYLLELPFIIWGFYTLFKKGAGLKNSIFVIIWLTSGVFSASLTVEESPNVNRALFVLPALQWLTALGLFEFYKIVKSHKKSALAIIISLSLFLIWNISYFLHQYTVHALVHKPWFRFYEMKEVVNFLTHEKQKYKKVYLTFNSTEPYIYFLFYNKTDPNQLQNTIKERGLNYIWNNIDNIKIVRNDCPIISDKEKGEVLAIYKINCRFPKGVRIVKKFRFTDNETPLIAVDFPPGNSQQYEELQYENKKPEAL